MPSMTCQLRWSGRLAKALHQNWKSVKDRSMNYSGRCSDRWDPTDLLPPSVRNKAQVVARTSGGDSGRTDGAVSMPEPMPSMTRQSRWSGRRANA
jgi:hypothetical protein